MKLAYRIVTPILSLAAIVLGIFLKMFYFVVGSEDETIGSIVNFVTQLTDKVSTTFEYSLFELIQMMVGGLPSQEAGESEEQAVSLAEVLSPIMPQLIGFFVIFVICVILMLAIGIYSAAKDDSKKKRYTVIGLSAAGLVLMFIGIIVSNSAFNAVINGEINLTNLVTALSESAIAALATAVLQVTRATLSAGFYAMFGFFILIILWTVLSNMLISTPIRKKKKYRTKGSFRSIIKK